MDGSTLGLLEKQKTIHPSCHNKANSPQDKLKTTIALNKKGIGLPWWRSG